MTTSWERRISRTDAPAVPILVRRMHRVFYVPPRYRAVCAATFDGRPTTIRRLAARTGYSVKGAWSALRQMERLGFGQLRTARGRRGLTRFRIQTDVEVCRNVSSAADPSRVFVDSRRTVVETFSQALI